MSSGHLWHWSSLDLLTEAMVGALGHLPRPLCTMVSWVREWVEKSHLSQEKGFTPRCLLVWYSILVQDEKTCPQSCQLQVWVEGGQMWNPPK